MLLVVVSATHLRIVDVERGDVEVFGGALKGRVLPSQTVWALSGSGDAAGATKLVLSLAKGHGHKDIWASVLDIRRPSTDIDDINCFQ